MGKRKIWVKRPGASATMVTIDEEDLVDDVRDKVLKKYGNTLGRSFDAPDVTLRIIPRDHPQKHARDGERTLGPEESIVQALDTYFAGGQAVEDALIIDVPVRRTPRASPRTGHHLAYYAEEIRPGDGGEYFPPMPAMIPSSPHLPSASVSSMGHTQGSHHPTAHSISILNTGQVPPLPSPQGSQIRGPRHHRPRTVRTHTTSPPITSNGLPPHLNTDPQQIPAAPPLPNPNSPTADVTHALGTPPPPRVASPVPEQLEKDKASSSLKAVHPELPYAALEGTVPPINVLIVEDNIINLKLLEAFMKRLKVRWQTAMNGREAVNKWRAGGFHLVLMDIQLPVMNGLDATKEIRRLERVNSIGVFSSSASPSAPEQVEQQEPEGDDKLLNTVLFKSPVIIVALTASSLQSDRHEALAAGCNDFLTKPVNFVWLERKVMEWGCMQALIDFDGWRKWKDFSSQYKDNYVNGHHGFNMRAGNISHAAMISPSLLGPGPGPGNGNNNGNPAAPKPAPTKTRRETHRSRAGTLAGALPPLSAPVSAVATPTGPAPAAPGGNGPAAPAAAVPAGTVDAVEKSGIAAGA